MRSTGSRGRIAGVRRLLDRVDQVLGRAFARVLAVVCLLAGLASFGTGVWSLRTQGFTWGLLLPLAAGLGFSWIGIWLWRVRRRLSDLDWSGV